MKLRRPAVLLATAGSALALSGGAYALVAPTGVTATSTDSVISTTANNNLSEAADTWTTIEKITLPTSSGTSYVVSASGSILNYLQADYFGCRIQLQGKTVASAQATIGDPNESGSVIDSSTNLANLAMEGAGTATGGVAELQCNHLDAVSSTTLGPPVMNAGATLYVHQSSSLTVGHVS